MITAEPYWIDIPLEQMSQAQWEALCDGCAYCCLVKLEDEDSGEMALTRVSCHLLDTDSCRCQDYPRRLQQVAQCMQLTPQVLPMVIKQNWLPTSCAYRLLYEGKPLPDWHPLVSGDAQTVHQAGASVKGFVLSEDDVHPDQLLDFMIENT